MSSMKWRPFCVKPNTSIKCHKMKVYHSYWLIQLTIPTAIKSLRPSDDTWQHWSWTTLAQVMACCLTAPSHYLNQCWLIIRGVLWHSSENSFAGIAQGINAGYEFEKDILKIIFKSPRGQWVNSSWPNTIFSVPPEATRKLQGFSKHLWVNREIRAIFQDAYMWHQAKMSQRFVKQDVGNIISPFPCIYEFITFLLSGLQAAEFHPAIASLISHSWEKISVDTISEIGWNL